MGQPLKLLHYYLGVFVNASDILVLFTNILSFEILSVLVECPPAMCVERYIYTMIYALLCDTYFLSDAIKHVSRGRG